jgi:tRNA A-37 threonylcarbamoyl transferase component Bud32
MGVFMSDAMSEGISAILASPKLLGRYEIHRKLGEGSMSEVYLATHLLLGRQVALKFLKPDAAEGYTRQSFQKEAQAVAALNHPNIMQVYDFDQIEEGQFFMSGEYLHDGDLLTQMRRREKEARPFRLDEILHIIRSVAAGLEYAHSKGIIHRDVKLSNIFLAEGLRVVVGDFGLAKILDLPAEGTLQGGIVGTPTYMSPEQLQGQTVDQRTDIYALGIVFFYLLAGQAPYSGNLTQLAVQHLHAPIPDILTFRPDLPPSIALIILTMLQKDANDRYPDFKAVLSSLDRLGQGHLEDDTLYLESSPALPLALPPAEKNVKLPLPPQSLKLPTWALALGLFLILALAAYAFLGRGGQGEESAQATLVIPPISPAQTGEYLVLVAPLVDEQSGTDLGSLVRDRLTTGELGLVLGDNLRVEALPQELQSQAEARAIGEALGASLLLWGQTGTNAWELEVYAPGQSEDYLDHLNLLLLRDADFASRALGKAPLILDYYARHLLLNRFIAMNDLYTSFYLIFSFRTLEPEAIELPLAPNEQKLFAMMLGIIDEDYVLADSNAANLLALYPQDSAFYLWRWVLNALWGQGDLAEQYALTLQNLSGDSDFSRALLLYTYTFFNDVPKLLPLGPQFGALSSNTANQMGTFQYWQILIHEGNFEDVAAFLPQVVAFDRNLSVDTEILLSEVVGDFAKRDRLRPLLIQSQETRFFAEVVAFFQQLQFEYFHPILFMRAYGTEQDKQYPLALLTYQLGLGLYPDDYLLQWRLGHVQEALGNAQAAYDFYTATLADAPVSFPIAAYDQALLVQAQGDKIEGAAPVCELATTAQVLAQESPDLYAALLSEIEALLQAEAC